MAEVVPIRPREWVELPPRPPPALKLGGRFPWRPFAALLVPGASLAGACGLQRWLEGPLATGDALLRWLALGTAIGLIAGAAAGLLLGRSLAARLAWTLWGVASPGLISLAAVGTATAVRPVRDVLAARLLAECRALGRLTCTVAEFNRACREAAAAPSAARDVARRLLGAPAQELCDAGGCTDRFRYEGPWTADSWVAPGALVCSVVSDAAGRGVRFALRPGVPPR